MEWDAPVAPLPLKYDDLKTEVPMRTAGNSARIALTSFLLALAAPVVGDAASIEDGFEAYRSGDYEGAYNIWRPLAEDGDPRAQTIVGTLYYEGRGVERDPEQAAEWYRMAAEQGHASAQAALGNMYHDGDGVPEDWEKAAEWLRKSAEQGHPGGQGALGSMYVAAHGVPQDYVEAYKWLTLATAQLPADGRRELVERMRSDLEANMTAEQIAEAERLVEEWEPVE